LSFEAILVTAILNDNLQEFSKKPLKSPRRFSIWGYPMDPPLMWQTTERSRGVWERKRSAMERELGADASASDSTL
jgi:hypothetical protein